MGRPEHYIAARSYDGLQLAQSLIAIMTANLVGTYDFCYLCPEFDFHHSGRSTGLMPIQELSKSYQ